MIPPDFPGRPPFAVMHVAIAVLVLSPICCALTGGWWVAGLWYGLAAHWLLRAVHSWQMRRWVARMRAFAVKHGFDTSRLDRL